MGSRQARFAFWILSGALFISPTGAWADEPIRLDERFAAGTQCHVNCRVELTGTLTPEPEKGKAPKPLNLRGESIIEYDERILEIDTSKSDVRKTFRIYRQIEFQRRIGDREQQQTIRPALRRLVLLRHNNTEVPFSPDGPLTWGEIDLVRTDVFTPGLAGLLPARPVRPGERWTASASAVKELTDLDRIEEGQIECKLEEVTAITPTNPARRQARVAFAGTVRGVNEDGPNRQELDGFFYFDLESNHLSYVTLKGVHTLLDKDGKEVGKVDGRFTLTRQTQQHNKDLTDAALKNLILEPNADNTLLLYENPDLGVRFLYPRRWRVATERGSQITLDTSDGNGLLLTVDTTPNTPPAAQYLKESRDWLGKQKVKVLREEPIKSLTINNGQLERFALEVEAGGQKALMDYLVIRQKSGGGTIAARLLPGDLTALRSEVERIARSLVVAPKR